MTLFRKSSTAGLVLLLHCVAGAADVAGHYTIVATPGAWLLELVSCGDNYTGSLVADGVVVGSVAAVGSKDEDGDYSVDGVITGQINAEFALYTANEDGDFRLLMIPLADGVADYGRATEYRAQAVDTVAAKAPTPESTASSGALPNPGLVGLWVAQVSTIDGAGSIATELYMEIRSDGYLVDRGSRAMASFDGAGLDHGVLSNGETVLWRSDGTTIYVSDDAVRWAPLASYELSGRRLLLRYYDGSRQLWYRR